MVTVSDFKAWQKEHPNFMTPSVLKVAQVKDSFVELSEGTGMEGEPIFGVSVIHYKDGKFSTDQTDINQMFFTKLKALAYFNDIKKKVK